MIASQELRCAGCGAAPGVDAPYPFRCPNADSGDGRDHVLGVVGGSGDGDAPWPPADIGSPQPFVRYRARLWSHALAASRGMADADFVALVEALDAAVARVDGHGFRVTPFAPEDALAMRLGRAPGTVWVKDETRHVAGSHKGRHLFGVALALEVAERTGAAMRAETDRRGLAIASCGNAALAAAVIARAARRPLRVFIPDDADPRVVSRLRALAAQVVICPRDPGIRGDPCMVAFRAAVRGGALPFCCQGSENGLTIEGGMTLAWEMADCMRTSGLALDRWFVQVGGGALASACAQALRRALAHGVLSRLPRLHTVQTEGGWPLRRAWERLRARMLPGFDGDDDVAAARMAALGTAARDQALRHAQDHRAEFMWPWESPPHSQAHGILDDETYDWLEVSRGLIESGGWPVTVKESSVREAHVLARGATAILADATGTAGLAGLMELLARGQIAQGERLALLFTGVERSV